MPTQTFHRTWCKTCNEFTLHYHPFVLNNESELTCRDCKTVFTDVTLAQIPRDKAKAQRIRYKESKSKRINSLMSTYLTGGRNRDIMFSEKWPDAEIIENPAGQDKIDEYKAFKHAEQMAIQQEERRKIMIERELFINVGRNDTCPVCEKNGLKIKFKKCTHFNTHRADI